MLGYDTRYVCGDCVGKVLTDIFVSSIESVRYMAVELGRLGPRITYSDEMGGYQFLLFVRSFGAAEHHVSKGVYQYHCPSRFFVT